MLSLIISLWLIGSFFQLSMRRYFVRAYVSESGVHIVSTTAHIKMFESAIQTLPMVGVDILHKKPRKCVCLLRRKMLFSKYMFTMSIW